MAHLSLTLQQCLVATIPAFTVVVESGYKRTLAHPAIYATILALCAGPIVMATGYSGAISPLGVVAQMLAVAAKHGIKPIIEEFPHSKANDAMAKVRDGSIRFRAVLKNDLI